MYYIETDIGFALWHDYNYQFCFNIRLSNVATCNKFNSPLQLCVHALMCYVTVTILSLSLSQHLECKIQECEKMRKDLIHNWVKERKKLVRI